MQLEATYQCYISFWANPHTDFINGSPLISPDFHWWCSGNKCCGEESCFQQMDLESLAELHPVWHYLLLKCSFLSSTCVHQKMTLSCVSTVPITVTLHIPSPWGPLHLFTEEAYGKKIDRCSPEVPPFIHPSSLSHPALSCAENPIACHCMVSYPSIKPHQMPP